MNERAIAAAALAERLAGMEVQSFCAPGETEPWITINVSLSPTERDLIVTALAAAERVSERSHDEELLRDADAFAEKLKGKTGHRIIVGLAEKVRDLRFSLEATNYLEHIRKPAVERVARDGLATACKPWEMCSGEPPDWDNPLMNVWQAACGWTLAIVGETLGAKDWEGGDGSETIDGDIAAEVTHIMRAAGLVNSDGDPITKSDLAALAAADRMAGWPEMAKRIDNADFVILRTVTQDDVGNSEFNDDHLTAEEHNALAAALAERVAGEDEIDVKHLEQLRGWCHDPKSQDEFGYDCARYLLAMVDNLRVALALALPPGKGSEDSRD